MRKSHTQKVADRRKKRQRRWMMYTYQGILNILRETKKFEYIEIPSPPWAIEGHAFIREYATTIFDGFFEEKSRAYAKDAAEKALIGPIINTSPDYEVFGVDQAANAAGKAFISALVAAVGAAEPATKFLSSMELLNPCLLERVRPSLVLHDDAAKVCPNCDGTGWSYHEHLPIERNVGCEDCGGCGDERGTGIIP